jgi:GNAT superfamily N-acetyltransferase
MSFERHRGNFTVSTDPGRLDLGAIHAFLSTSYWAEGIPRETVERALRHSLCFGLYEEEGRQIGFARVITDTATYAYLCDVYVLPEWRGQGLGTWMMEQVMDHPDLQGLRRFSLVTRDAHELYRPFGFTEISNPGRYMEIARPGIYKNPHPPGVETLEGVSKASPAGAKSE